MHIDAYTQPIHYVTPPTDEACQISDLDRAPLSRGIVLLFTIDNSSRANEKLATVTQGYNFHLWQG